ncbi:MAG: NapC/NirT family cytochrome c [Proteobacteria bacterium]|nr:NapC/NirT family cytochrome c [Pseudomonadota bacterium]MBU1716884.1 NapC/NirT family cytochrome c [Pseudomonadota bacterium]
MNKNIQLSLLILLTCFFTSIVSAEANTTCFKCHKKANFSGKVVHSPVAENKCSSCHNPHVARYKNLLSSEVSELCYQCHQDKIESFSKGIVHKPVKKGECLSCHAPHASSNKGLLNESAPGENCFKCHKTLLKKYDYTHQPYEKGDCGACHRAHQSERAQLLNDEPDKLCSKCHQENILQQKHQGFPGRLRVCLSCHNPHGSERKNLIRNVLHAPYKEGCSDCHEKGPVKTDKCLECHEEIMDQLLSAHNHLTDKAVNSCVKCHSPHAADSNSMLKNRQNQICRSCHANTFAGYDNTLHSHPDTGSCSDCHALHGSNNMAMLKGNGIEVCDSCHKTQGQFTHPVGGTVLDPRTGQQVTCVSCHYPHGTNFKFNLKLSGGKDLCIQCHKSY